MQLISCFSHSQSSSSSFPGSVNLILWQTTTLFSGQAHCVTGQSVIGRFGDSNSKAILSIQSSRWPGIQGNIVRFSLSLNCRGRLSSCDADRNNSHASGKSCPISRNDQPDP